MNTYVGPGSDVQQQELQEYVGFEIILVKCSRLFCDSLTCHYPSNCIKTHQKKNRPEPPPSRQPYSSLVNIFVIKTRLVAIIRAKTTY